jgi:hypothetical protein
LNTSEPQKVGNYSLHDILNIPYIEHIRATKSRQL